MLTTRRLPHCTIHQIAEISGPTHGADWMLPDLDARQLVENRSWLEPSFWLAPTNRLVFTMQAFVINTGDATILLDTGVGNHKRRPAASQDNLNTPFLDWLGAISCPPERVTHVVHTHLHGDHVGWNTQRVDGRFEPMFPNATYYFPAHDWAVFSERAQRQALGYHTDPFEDSVVPIHRAGLVRFIEPGMEVAGLLRALAAPGHSPGQLAYLLRDGETLLFSADVLHNPMQVLHPHVNSRWCEEGDTARATRLRLLTLAAREKCLVLPSHALGLEGWSIRETDGRFEVRINSAPCSESPFHGV